MAAARQAPRRARAGQRVFRPLRLGHRGQPHALRPAARLPAALLLRRRVLDAHPALPAVPDQALHGAVRRPHRQARIRRHRRRGARLPGRPQSRGPAGAVAAHGQGLGRARIRAARRCCATASARSPTSSRTSRSALPSIDEADIFAAHAEGGQVCVQVFFLRAGQNLGNRAYFPSHVARARRARGAVGLHRPVLRSAAGAQAHPDQPRRRRARAAGKRAGPRGGAQGRDPHIPSAATRRTRSTRRAATRARRWRGAWPSAARSASCSKAWRRLFGLDGAARAHRDLRQQPYPGQRADRRHGRGGAGRFHQEHLSQVQHQDRGRGGRRLRHDARGADAPLRPRAEGRSRTRPRSTGPTWC